jgi:murein DD-endopeptidase MepM/ murein hydrolase activator NlpD
MTYAVYFIFFIPKPAIKGTEAFHFLPAEKTITLTGTNLESVEILIQQGDHEIELLRDKPARLQKTYTIQVKPKNLNLKDGQAIITVKARGSFLKKTTYEVKATVDTLPPDLTVLKAPFMVDLGSSGFTVLRTQDADAVFIKLENNTFKAFKASSSTKSEPATSLELDSIQQPQGDGKYFAFFPVPFDTKEGSILYAIAEDTAGNQNIKSLPTRLKHKKFKTSSITVKESFINTVVAPLLNQINISDPVTAFKTVNEDWRADNLKKLREIGQNTEQKFLWEGRFNQLRNSKVMATFGDKRTYFFKGKKISKSGHLGYDLASTAHAMIDASNAGVVKFAGELGIYGNTVIIDHGLGLMSLYGHLSTILVKEGQAVEKGEIIARSGASGLAGGDHLHFGILVHGHEVSPLYWWDQHWINVNILEFLR